MRKSKTVKAEDLKETETPSAVEEKSGGGTQFFRLGDNVKLRIRGKTAESKQWKLLNPRAPEPKHLNGKTAIVKFITDEPDQITGEMTQGLTLETEHSIDTGSASEMNALVRNGALHPKTKKARFRLYSGDVIMKPSDFKGAAYAEKKKKKKESKKTAANQTADNK